MNNKVHQKDKKILELEKKNKEISNDLTVNIYLNKFKGKLISFWLGKIRFGIQGKNESASEIRKRKKRK